MLDSLEQQVPVKLTVSNRQRTQPVELKKIVQMTQKLSAAVFSCLIDDLPEHLDAESLEHMAERGQFSLALVSDRQIQSLNKDWMGKNKPTDVLSFPLSLDPPPDDELPWEVGEIVISVQKAKQQALDYGHSFEREMAFLFVHGMLHVLGFDHMEPADEKEMFGRQRQILDSCGFNR